MLGALKKPFSKCQRAGNGQAPQTGRFSQLLYEGGNGESVSEIRRNNLCLILLIINPLNIN